MLLTGNSQLRMPAENSQIETHGVLWGFDELLKNQLLPPMHCTPFIPIAADLVRLLKKEM
jgi:hypothetical protein